MSTQLLNEQLQLKVAAIKNLSKDLEFAGPVKLHAELPATVSSSGDLKSRAAKALIDVHKFLSVNGASLSESKLEAKHIAVARQAADELEIALEQHEATQELVVPHIASGPAVNALKRNRSEVEPNPALQVAIYGSSRAERGDGLWELAESVGEELGKHGMHLITGGYCGTMEAISLGGSKTSGTVVEGIIAPTAFPKRPLLGNAHLNVITPTETLQDRIMLFTKKADAFVVLPGNVGTLTEFALTWCLSIVNTFSDTPTLKIYAFRNPWEQWLQLTAPLLGVSQEDLDLITIVDSVDDLLSHLVPLQEQKHKRRAASPVEAKAVLQL